MTARQLQTRSPGLPTCTPASPSDDALNEHSRPPPPPITSPAGPPRGTEHPGRPVTSPGPAGRPTSGSSPAVPVSRCAGDEPPRLLPLTISSADEDNKPAAAAAAECDVVPYHERRVSHAAAAGGGQRLQVHSLSSHGRKRRASGDSYEVRPKKLLFPET